MEHLFYAHHRLPVKYYQHWYKDSTATSHVERVSKGDWRVKYLGSEPESSQSISYEYSTPGGGGSGNDEGLLQKIGPDYYLSLGTSRNPGFPGSKYITMALMRRRFFYERIF